MASDRPIITLTTDFGLRDGYVGIAKGAILSINRNVDLIDLSHDVPSWSIESGAWIICNAHRYFPAGTIHLCVVDPSVGSFSQRGLAITNGKATFVGPDNGILSMLVTSAVNRQSTSSNWRCYHLQNQSLWRKEVSMTFHTRDIYAPVCGHLSNGVPIGDVGPEVPIDSIIPLCLEPFERTSSACSGSIVHVDKFGNLITNIPGEDLKPDVRCLVSGKSSRYQVLQVGSRYSDVSKGTVIALVGSHGFVEIGVNQGRADETLNASFGNRVHLEPSC